MRGANAKLGSPREPQGLCERLGAEGGRRRYSMSEGRLSCSESSKVDLTSAQFDIAADSVTTVRDNRCSASVEVNGRHSCC